MAIKINTKTVKGVSVRVSSGFQGLSFSIDTSASDLITYAGIYTSAIVDRVESDGGTINESTCLDAVISELNPSSPFPSDGILNLTGLGGAEFAYGLENLRKEYLGAILKVSKSDGSTLDVYANTSGQLDIDSLSDFAGSDNVYVHTWYDQGFYGNHAKQEDVTLMPIIVENGSYLGYVKNQTINTGSNLIPRYDYSATQNFATLALVRQTGNGVVMGTSSSSEYYIVGQSGNGLDPEALFTSMTYNINGEAVEYTRDEMYSALNTDNFVLVTAQGQAPAERRAELGYGSLKSFDNNQYKQVIIYGTVPAELSDAENNIISKYNL